MKIANGDQRQSFMQMKRRANDYLLDLNYLLSYTIISMFK